MTTKSVTKTSSKHPEQETASFKIVSKHGFQPNITANLESWPPTYYNLEAMASNLLAMASNLIAMASNQIAMASKLLAMADGIQTNRDGLQPRSEGLQPRSDCLQLTSDGLRPTGNGLRPTGNGLRPTGDGLRPTGDGLQPQPFRPIRCVTPSCSARYEDGDLEHMTEEEVRGVVVARCPRESARRVHFGGRTSEQ